MADETPEVQNPLPPALIDLLTQRLGSPPEAREIARAVTELSVSLGPIPPAEELARYEEALPGAADRIIGMAEQEQAGRIKLRAATVGTERIRIVASVFLGALLIGVCGLATYTGNAWIAVPTGLAGLGMALLRPITSALTRYFSPPSD